MPLKYVYFIVYMIVMLAVNLYVYYRNNKK